MDFYHVLPSNTSPDYFPNNNASCYSTPLDVPYVLDGEWQVGLMNFTYSTCVNTFNNDKIIVKEKCSLAECASKATSPLKVMLPVPEPGYGAGKARDDLAIAITNKLKSLLQVKVSEDKLWATWKILNNDFYFVLSHGIRSMYQLWSDVITDMDASYTNKGSFYNSYIPTEQSDVWIMIVPKKADQNEKYTTFELKKKGETLTAKQLFQRFEEKVDVNIAKLTLENDVKFILTKVRNDNYMILSNAPLRKAFTFTRAGMFGAGEEKYFNANMSNQKDEWTFTVIHLSNIEVFDEYTTKVITLPPSSFQEESVALNFINAKVNDKRITFKCDVDKTVTLSITADSLIVIFDDDLRDIFAFNTNTFRGSNTFKSSKAMSLTRCIQYLYIYSNIGDDVRVGNTKSQLLAIVPFSNEKACTLLKEKSFKVPMYIRVIQKRISQIDIAIYDGAGKLVPFLSDVVTTLNLHFRKVY